MKKLSTGLASAGAAFALAAAVGISASAGWGPDSNRAGPGAPPRKPAAPARNPDKERIIAMNGGREPVAPTQDPGSLRGPGCTGTSFAFTPNLVILDNSIAEDPQTVVATGTISDLNVELNITHTWQGDVTVTLIHDGVTVPLVSRPGLAGPPQGGCCGFGSDNYGLAGGAPFILDDQASPAQTYDTPQVAVGINNVAGSWLPDADGIAAHLSDFNGHPIAGAWTLHVEDGANLDTGAVTRWALCINTPPPAPTGSCCVGTDCSIRTQAACTGTWTLNGTCTFGADGSPNPPYIRTPNLPIPDANAAGVFDVANVTDTYLVGSMKVHVNIPDHTYLSDLIITLTSPAGTPVVLWNHLCFNTDGMTCDFDDAAAVVVCPTTPLTPVTGSVKPSVPLSTFRGQQVNGNWTLAVADTVGADLGTLVDWSMTIAPRGASTSCIPTGPDCFTRGQAGPLGSGCQTPILTHTRPQANGHFTRGGPDGSADAAQCVGDWDGDGCVVPADVSAFISSWFYSASNPGNLDGDIDCDGTAVPADVSLYIQRWFGGLNSPAAEGCV